MIRLRSCLINPGLSICLWHDLFSNKIFYSRLFFHLGPSFQPNKWKGIWGSMFSYVCVHFSLGSWICCSVLSVDMFLDFMYVFRGLVHVYTILSIFYVICTGTDCH